MMFARGYRVIPLIALAAASCAPSGGTGNDAEVQAAIEQAWSQPILGLVLGDVRFIERSPGVRRADVSKGEDFVTELPLYRAAAANRLITMTEEPDRIRIVPTDSGLRRGTVIQIENTQELLVRINTARVDTILANDSLVVEGGDRYRVVTGTYTLEIDADFKAAFVQARGDTLPPERRFKALLRYDPISQGWTVAGFDVGPRSGDFPTPNVDQAQAQLRQCGKVAC